ncbi:MAG: hypothetical protein ACLP5V_10795 [Candidatus Bathyarchaeia archaeon]
MPKTVPFSRIAAFNYRVGWTTPVVKGGPHPTEDSGSGTVTTGKWTNHGCALRGFVRHLLGCVIHVYYTPKLPDNAGRYAEERGIYQRLYGCSRIAQVHGFNNLSR